MHNFLALPTLSGYRCRAFTSSDTAQIVSFQLDAALSIHNALQHRYDAFAISHPSDGTVIVNRSLVNFEPNNHCSKTTHYTAYYDTLLNQGQGSLVAVAATALGAGLPIRYRRSIERAGSIVPSMWLQSHARAVRPSFEYTYCRSGAQSTARSAAGRLPFPGTPNAGRCHHY